MNKLVIWANDYGHDLNEKSPNCGDQLSFFDGTSHICHFQHLCQHPKIKTRKENRFALFRGKKTLKSFLSLISFEGYTSGERSKNMQVHIDVKKMRRFLTR